MCSVSIARRRSNAHERGAICRRAADYPAGAHPVTGIDAGRRQVMCDTRHYDYHTLVLATGASAVIPPVPGHEWMLTLNSQQEYRRAEARLTQATRILILGAGLIGSELAMDMAQAGKHVTLVDRASHLLSALLPVEISARLQAALLQQGVELMLNNELQQLEKPTPA